MAPRLRAGTLVIAQPIDAATRLHVGDVVIARRPDRPQLEIIKRIHHIDSAGALMLAGDNPKASTESVDFGMVRREHIVALVRWRYWPLPPIRL